MFRCGNLLYADFFIYYPTTGSFICARECISVLLSTFVSFSSPQLLTQSPKNALEIGIYCQCDKTIRFLDSIKWFVRSIGVGTQMLSCFEVSLVHLLEILPNAKDNMNGTHVVSNITLSCILMLVVAKTIMPKKIRH